MSNSDDSLACVICQDQLVDDVCSLQCGHSVHTPCLEQWQKTQSKNNVNILICIFCRRPSRHKIVVKSEVAEKQTYFRKWMSLYERDLEYVGQVFKHFRIYKHEYKPRLQFKLRTSLQSSEQNAFFPSPGVLPVHMYVKYAQWLLDRSFQLKSQAELVGTESTHIQTDLQESIHSYEHDVQILRTRLQELEITTQRLQERNNILQNTYTQNQRGALQFFFLQHYYGGFLDAASCIESIRRAYSGKLSHPFYSNTYITLDSLLTCMRAVRKNYTFPQHLVNGKVYLFIDAAIESGNTSHNNHNNDNDHSKAMIGANGKVIGVVDTLKRSARVITTNFYLNYKQYERLARLRAFRTQHGALQGTAVRVPKNVIVSTTSLPGISYNKVELFKLTCFELSGVIMDTAASWFSEMDSVDVIYDHLKDKEKYKKTDIQIFMQGQLPASDVQWRTRGSIAGGSGFDTPDWQIFLKVFTNSLSNPQQNSHLNNSGHTLQLPELQDHGVYWCRHSHYWYTRGSVSTCNSDVKTEGNRWYERVLDYAKVYMNILMSAWKQSGILREILLQEPIAETPSASLLCMLNHEILVRLMATHPLLALFLASFQVTNTSWLREDQTQLEQSLLWIAKSFSGICMDCIDVSISEKLVAVLFDYCIEIIADLSGKFTSDIIRARLLEKDIGFCVTHATPASELERNRQGVFADQLVKTIYSSNDGTFKKVHTGNTFIGGADHQKVHPSSPIYTRNPSIWIPGLFLNTNNVMYDKTMTDLENKSDVTPAQSIRQLVCSQLVNMYLRRTIEHCNSILGLNENMTVGIGSELETQILTKEREKKQLQQEIKDLENEVTREEAEQHVYRQKYKDIIDLRSKFNHTSHSQTNSQVLIKQKVEALAGTIKSFARKDVVLDKQKTTYNSAHIPSSPLKRELPSPSNDPIVIHEDVYTVAKKQRLIDLEEDEQEYIELD